MALQNYFSNYDKTKEPIPAIKACGVKVERFQNSFTPGATDNAASTYLIMKNVSAHLTIAELLIEHGSVTGASSCDVGFYDSFTGSALTKQDGTTGKAVLASGLDLTTGNTKITPKDGLAAVTGSNTLKPIWQLLGFAKAADAKPQYDIVMTMNNAPTAAVEVTARGALRSNW